MSETDREHQELPFKALLACPLIGLYIVQDGRFQAASAEFQRSTGYSEAELIGTSPLTLVFPDDRNMVREQAIAMLKGERSSPYEFRIAAKSGELRWAVETVASIGYHGRRAVLGNFMDITKQKQLAMDLRESKDKLQSMFEAVQDAVLMMDDEGKISFCNSTAEAMFGYAREDLLGKDLHQTIAPQRYREAYKKAFGKFKLTGQGAAIGQTLQVEALRRDGTEFPVEFSLAAVSIKGKWQALGIIRDITERKQAEERLNKEKAFTSSLLQGLQNGFAVIDQTGRHIMVNAALCQMTGYSEQELLNQKLPFSYWVEEDLEEINTAFEEILKGIEGEHERIFKTKNGERFIALVSPRKTIDPDGNTVFFATVQDITERKRAEAAIWAMVESTAGIATPNFFNNMVQTLCEWLHCDVALVGELVDESTVRALAMQIDGEIAGEYRYALSHTPCEQVAQKGFCHYTKNVSSLFPDDADLAKLNLSGYVGIPLRNTRGEPLGILCAMSHKPLELPAGVEEVMSVFAARAAGVIMRQRAEEEHRAAEQNFRNSLDSSPLGIRIVTEKGELLYANQAILDIYGYSSIEELKATPTKQRYTPKSYAEYQERQARRKLGEPTPSHYEISIIRKDGEIRHLSVFRSEVTWNDKAEFQTLYLDITERKRAEESSRALFEATLDGAFIIDAETMKIVLSNEAAANIFGFDSAEDAIGVNPVDLIPPDDRDQIIRIIAEDMLAKDLRQVNELRAITRDGREIWIRAIGMRTEYQGRLAGLVSFWDITERKQVEQERERIIRELEAFAYTLSHDLRGPLHTIRSFAKSLRVDLERNQRERVMEDARLIETGIDKMERLLKAVLRYSRAGITVQPSKNVPFAQIVNEALGQLAGNISSSGATVSVAEDFPTVDADHMRMTEVLANLIENSIDYRDRSRPLTIEIGHRRSNSEVVFFVRDNGTGIDPGKHDKIFQLFQRGTRAGSGIGAGLAIVKRIIEAHGGRIWVEGEPGKGATICFTLAPSSRTAPEATAN